MLEVRLIVHLQQLVVVCADPSQDQADLLFKAGAIRTSATFHHPISYVVPDCDLSSLEITGDPIYLQILIGYQQFDLFTNHTFFML